MPKKKAWRFTISGLSCILAPSRTFCQWRKRKSVLRKHPLFPAIPPIQKAACLSAGGPGFRFFIFLSLFFVPVSFNHSHSECRQFHAGQPPRRLPFPGIPPYGSSPSYIHHFHQSASSPYGLFICSQLMNNNTNTADKLFQNSNHFIHLLSHLLYSVIVIIIKQAVQPVQHSHHGRCHFQKSKHVNHLLS